MSILTKENFVLNIGKSVSSLIHVKDNNIVEFIEGNFIRDRERFSKALSASKTAPISVILDNWEQQYVKEKILAHSLSEADKLVKEKLKEDYNEFVFKGCFPVSADRYEYLFVIIHKNKEIEEWFDYLVDLPNRIKGVFSARLEAKAVIDKIRTYKTKWEVLVYNKEYIIFCDELCMKKSAFNSELMDELNKDLLDVGYKKNEEIFILNLNRIGIEELKKKLEVKSNFISLSAIMNYVSVNYKRDYKLYNPAISSLILTEALNYYMNILLISGTILMIIIFILLWIYVR